MSVTLSPIYAHFSETLTGLATIRALRDEARFKQENEFRLETNQRANFCGKLRCTVAPCIFKSLSCIKKEPRNLKEQN